MKISYDSIRPIRNVALGFAVATLPLFATNFISKTYMGNVPLVAKAENLRAKLVQEHAISVVTDPEVDKRFNENLQEFNRLQTTPEYQIQKQSYDNKVERNKQRGESLRLALYFSSALALGAYGLEEKLKK